MEFLNVYYFHVTYGYDAGTKWEERDEYGFISARDFNDAMTQIVDIHRDDLQSVTFELIGDTTIISIDNEAVAKSFKECYVKTHYE